MHIITKTQAKSFISALRRELKQLEKPANRLSHSECLALVAKTMGFASWNAWNAALKDEPTALKQEVAPAKYPLTNDGEFDFVPRGEHGTACSGHFVRMAGTVEKLPGMAGVMLTARHGAPEDKELDIDYEGVTDIDWDNQQTLKDARGYMVWADEDGRHYPGAQLVLLPGDYDYDSDPCHDEELPVRDKLVLAFAAYCKEKGVDADDLSRRQAAVEQEIGFSLTLKEVQALRLALPGRTPAISSLSALSASSDSQGKECPSCGTQGCSHTLAQMQGFAQDAVKDAADWLESMSAPVESSPNK